MPEKPGSWRDITRSCCIPGFKVDGIVVNQAPKSSLSTGMWREGSDPGGSNRKEGGMMPQASEKCFTVSNRKL